LLGRKLRRIIINFDEIKWYDQKNLMIQAAFNHGFVNLEVIGEIGKKLVKNSKE